MCFLVNVVSKQPLDHTLRPYPFMVMVYLATVRCHTRCYYMYMCVVSIGMSVNQQGLSFFSISHLPEIFMGEVQKFLFRLFVSPA